MGGWPALLRKIHEAREAGATEVEVWGTGKPRREFLHVDDLADACVFLMRNYDGDGWVNVGWGRDETIAELADTIRRVVDSQARYVSTRRSRTALRASCWIPRVSPRSGGRRRSGSKRASVPRMNGF